MRSSELPRGTAQDTENVTIMTMMTMCRGSDDMTASGGLEGYLLDADGVVLG